MTNYWTYILPICPYFLKIRFKGDYILMVSTFILIILFEFWIDEVILTINLLEELGTPSWYLSASGRSNEALLLLLYMAELINGLRTIVWKWRTRLYASCRCLDTWLHVRGYCTFNIQCSPIFNNPWFIWPNLFVYDFQSDGVIYSW